MRTKRQGSLSLVSGSRAAADESKEIHMSKTVTVYRTVTYAIPIDLEEEGLAQDASDEDIINCAMDYTDDSWDEMDSETEVESTDVGPETDDDGDWDDDGEVVFDDDAAEDESED